MLPYIIYNIVMCIYRDFSKSQFVHEVLQFRQPVQLRQSPLWQFRQPALYIFLSAARLMLPSTAGTFLLLNTEACLLTDSVAETTVRVVE